MAGNKYISNNAGTLTEVASVDSSAGAGDSGKIVALNASGVLDATIVNSKTSSAGAGDAAKLVALDVTGKIDNSMMPTGIGADTSSVLTSEDIADGSLVNIYNISGTANCRKADASVAGKEAHGYVLAATTASENAVVYFEGTNDHVTGLTPGKQFLSTTAGGSSDAAPSGSGNVVQIVGFATSATSMNFQSSVHIVLE